MGAEEALLYEMCSKWRRDMARDDSGGITPANTSYDTLYHNSTRSNYTHTFNSTGQVLLTNYYGTGQLLTSINGTGNVVTDFNGTEQAMTNILAEFCTGSAGSKELQDLLTSPLDKLTYHLNGIGGLVICILGFIANLMSISVLKEKSLSPSSSKGSTSSTALYLIALAVADSLLLVFAACLSMNTILRVTFPGSVEINNYVNYTATFVEYLVNIFQTCSIWLTVAFTVDRYIMICHPFGGVKYCTRHRALVVITCLYVLAAIYNTPDLFEFKSIPQLRVKEGKQYYYVKRELTPFGSSREYLSIYHLGMYLVFIVVLPCLILAVLNLRLIITVKKSKSTERRLSLGTSTVQHRNDTTIMLVAVVVVFFFLQVPAMTSHIIWSLVPAYVMALDPQYNGLRIMQDVSNFLVVLNSAVNILLYYAFSRNFRRKFASKFCRRPCKQARKLFTSELRRKLSCRSANTEATEGTWYAPYPKQINERKPSRSNSLIELSTASNTFRFENRVVVTREELASTEERTRLDTNGVHVE